MNYSDNFIFNEYTSIWFVTCWQSTVIAPRASRDSSTYSKTITHCETHQKKLDCSITCVYVFQSSLFPIRDDSNCKTKSSHLFRSHDTWPLRTAVEFQSRHKGHSSSSLPLSNRRNSWCYKAGSSSWMSSVDEPSVAYLTLWNHGLFKSEQDDVVGVLRFAPCLFEDVINGFIEWDWCALGWTGLTSV